MRIANVFLGVKKQFINIRQQTIKKLQEVCDVLEEANIGRYSKIEEISKAFSALGKVCGNWVPLNIIEPVGDGVSIINSRNKRKFAVKNSEEFQKFLTSEEESLNTFQEIHNSLLENVRKNSGLEIVPVITNALNLEERSTNGSFEPKLFSIHYKIYEVATRIWPKKIHLDSSDMKEAIGSLTENLQLLTDELKSQEKSLERFNQEQTQTLVVQAPRFRY